MAQYAGARAGTGRETMARIIQTLADRVRKLEMYYTFRDTPSPSGPSTVGRVLDDTTRGLVLVGSEGHMWQLGVDEHGRLVAEDGTGARTVLAASNHDGGML